MSSPPLVPVAANPGPTPGPAAPPPLTRRSVQIALASLFFLLIGLLLYRGYGNRFGARPTEPVAAIPTRQIDLNASDRDDLEQIPGIGPKLAHAIDEHRKAQGPFQSVDDLRSVHGFGPATVDKIRPFVRVGPTAEPPEPLVLTRKPASAAKAPTSTSRGKVPKIGPGEPAIDVNSASLEELQRLPGVGPAMAQRIADRRAVAAFQSVEDLRKVRGVGEKTLDNLRPFVTVK